MKSLAAILIIDSCLAVYRVPDSAGTGMNLFGVNPEKEYMYKSDVLVCPGNPSKKLTPEMINDDFCDCPEDGFDEPGTSACNNGVFYCANKEFFPKEISSTLVNDGVCDCCDGSDESGITEMRCPNNCAELRMEFDRIESEKNEIIKKGMEAKEQMIAKGREMREMHKKQIEIGRLDLQASQMRLEALRAIESGAIAQPEIVEAVPETAEEFCKSMQLKYEKVKDIFAQLSESQEICKSSQQAVETFKAIETQTVDDSHILFDEIMDEQPIDEEKKRSLWESLMKLDFSDFRNFFRQHRVTKTITIVSPAGPTTPPTDVKQDPIKELEQKIIEDKLKLDEFERKYDKDYGTNEVFLALEEQCIEMPYEKYIYKLCFFKKIEQAEMRSAMYTKATGLGTWKGWGEYAEGNPDYTRMIFDGGELCWQGPQRNTEVILECGTENQIIDVTEPNICTYKMRVKTPAVCDA